MRFPVTPIELSGGVSGAVARLDLIHPQLSGNKLFKLWYYLERYRTGGYQRLVTFGGAYSNHLLATAYACHEAGIPCTGIVRGEAPKQWGPTLLDCERYGMELRFVSRQVYKDQHMSGNSAFGESGTQSGEDPTALLIVPEGGAGEDGIRGASLICKAIPGFQDFTHILCAVGTGTTIAGIDRELHPGQSAIGIPVLKIPPAERATFCKGRQLLFDYAFGGYARWNPELIAFMNTFFQATEIPTDFVYTAKAAFALYDLAGNGFFPKDSRILLIHTGGLQGNRSLPPDLLGF